MQRNHLWPTALGFALSLGLYLCLWLPGISHLAGLVFLQFSLHAIPAFFLQQLVLQATQNRLVQAVPLLPPAALLAIALFYFVRDSGWDRLGALIVFMFTIAPISGCVAARLFRRHRQKGDAAS